MHSIETDPRNTVRGALNKGKKITRKDNIPAKGTARNPQLHKNTCGQLEVPAKALVYTLCNS